MTIFVTGACGFIGLNLLRHLVVAHPEATVLAADLIEDDCLPKRGNCHFEKLDVRDRETCFRMFKRVKPTHFVHAAAVTIADDTEACAQWMRAVNFDGTVNVLDAAADSDSIRRGIIVSSSAVYGTQRNVSDCVPCDESHPLNPTGSYANAKHDAELLMTLREATLGFPIVAARVGPVYGPFERMRPSRPRTSIIQQLLAALLQERTVRIGGSDMHRDWTHASDVAAALDNLLFAPDLAHRVYNVGSGDKVSSREIISLFTEQGLRVTWTDDLDHAEIVLSEQDSRAPLIIERLKRDTGFAPRFNIRSGIRALVEGSPS